MSPKSIFTYLFSTVIFYSVTACTPEKCSFLDKPTQSKSAHMVNLYSDVFCQTCLPTQINLRLPGNLLIPSDRGERSKSIPIFPHITTVLLKSETKETFSVVRADYNNKKWSYSEETSCMAYSWKNSVLNLTLERNLQMNVSKTMEKVVFIVYIPFELARDGTEIKLYPVYGNRAIKISPTPFGKMSEISHISDKKDAFSPGLPLPEKVVKEIDYLSNGGIAYDDDIKSSVHEMAPVTYKPGPSSPSCFAPENFNS